MEEEIALDHKDIAYPPGGVLIWIVIFLELITFSFGLVAFVYYGKNDADLYHTSSQTLNKSIAIANTFILLTSSYFMAVAIDSLKIKNSTKGAAFIKYTLLMGMLFVVLKTVDYYLKIQAGELLTTNIFYTFYWMLTAFHLIHVIIGLLILSYFYYTLKNGNSPLLLTDSTAGAAFWHLCDLIWLLLFPALYLLY